MRRRKLTDKSINKKLDIMWSKLVKEKADYKCEVCGATSLLNSHHIIGRVNRSLRWDLQNGVCLCVKHHEFGIQSAHQDPQWFMEWVETYRPEDYRHVKSLKYAIHKWTTEEKLVQLEEFENYVG